MSGHNIFVCFSLIFNTNIKALIESTNSKNVIKYKRFTFFSFSAG